MKVFLSYTHEDEMIARKITATLRDAGLEVWFDQTEILPGDNWAEKVAQALRESDAMVVLLSSHALKSKWVRRDIEYALGEERYKKRLIPVRVGTRQKQQPQNFPWILKHLNMIDLKGTRSMKGIKEIADVLLQKS